MELSVIIPTYNRVGLIKHTLDSLNDQYHPGIDFEVIVIDDNSSDDTCNSIKKNYPLVRLYKNNGIGVAAARNTGLAMASGKYIMYLDSDDLVGPGYFAKKIAFLEANATYNACYGDYDFFSSEGVLMKDDIMFIHKYPMLNGKQHRKTHLTNFLSGNFIPPHSIIWQKEFIQKLNGHDEDLVINQDVELFIRSIFHGLNISAIEDGTSVYVRQHALDKRVGNPSNNNNKWQQILDLRKKIFTDLKEYSFDEAECFEAMSNYLFNYWRSLRHSDKRLADSYLDFAKSVYWPVKIKGSAGFRLLSAVLGPVRAVEVKYFLLKRD